MAFDWQKLIEEAMRGSGGERDGYWDREVIDPATGRRVTISNKGGGQAFDFGGFGASPGWDPSYAYTATVEDNTPGAWAGRDYTTQRLGIDGTPIGDLMAHRKGTAWTDFRDNTLKPVATGIAGMVGMNMLGPAMAGALAGEGAAGGAALTGWDAAMADLAASASPFGADALGTTALGGFSLPAGSPALGNTIESLPALTSGQIASITPGAFDIGGLGSAATTAAKTLGQKSATDKLSDFASDPANWLKTAGVIGTLKEMNDPNNTYQTKQNSLDPRLDAALFGADGKGGVFNDLQTWYASNPGGQNQTMRDAQTKLREILGNPVLQDSYVNQGAIGNGLMQNGFNRGDKPWWWKG